MITTKHKYSKIYQIILKFLIKKIGDLILITLQLYIIWLQYKQILKKAQTKYYKIFEFVLDNIINIISNRILFCLPIQIS